MGLSWPSHSTLIYTSELILCSTVHELQSSVSFTYEAEVIVLRWYRTLKYDGFHEKFNFLKIQDLRPLNTCQKHFEMILPNFPLDECEI